MSVNYEFLKNLDEKKLYKLWCLTSHKQYIEEYINSSEKINWNKFTENIKINNIFTEKFKYKLTVKCCICKNNTLYIKSRSIPEYLTIMNYKFSHICFSCDNKYKILDCENCYGNNVSGIMYCCDESCKSYIHFVCCKPPSINDTCHHCIHKNNIESHGKFFCMIHLQKNILKSDCKCSILCRKCFDFLQDEYNLDKLIDYL